MSQAQNNSGRPLSPHLSIYNLPLTARLSILHRVTGVGLAGGVLLLAWWLIAIGSGDAASYELFQTCMTSIPGRLVLLGFTVALNFHLCTGLRHLYWDTGKGFDVSTHGRSGALIIIGTAVLTIGEWALAYGVM